MTEKLLRKVHKQQFVGIRKTIFVGQKKSFKKLSVKPKSEANKKGEKIMTLDTLNFQLQNLQYLQKNLSDKSGLCGVFKE
jgi:hypothetical protein